MLKQFMNFTIAKKILTINSLLALIFIVVMVYAGISMDTVQDNTRKITGNWLVALIQLGDMRTEIGDSVIDIYQVINDENPEYKKQLEQELKQYAETIEKQTSYF